MNDFLQRFTLEQAAIRGQIVRLSDSLQAAVTQQHYSAPTEALLHQFFAAAALLSSTIKFDGQLSLQAKSKGHVSLIMAECTNTGDFRGIAQEQHNQANELSFSELLKEGTLAITITPTQGQRYQGIVPLEGADLGECLATYFQQSEQLKTWFKFADHDNNSAALMLQVLPASTLDENDWETAVTLASTASAEELNHSDCEQLLYQLFHSLEVRAFDASPLQFNCSCSEQRGLAAIKALGAEEANQLLAEQGEISLDCEFCGTQYRYGEQELKQLFAAGGASTTH